MIIMINSLDKEELLMHKRYIYRIYFIYILASFVTFPSYPMSIQIRTNTIEYFARKSIVLPLLSVKCENRFIH